jgi:hypothetical protein
MGGTDLKTPGDPAGCGPKLLLQKATKETKIGILGIAPPLTLKGRPLLHPRYGFASVQIFVDRSAAIRRPVYATRQGRAGLSKRTTHHQFSAVIDRRYKNKERAEELLGARGQ